jgi:hypothetical protein
MEATDSPFRAADLRHGYQVVADNLPNDPRSHEVKGSKEIFFKNVQDPRTDYVVLPVAKQVMRPDQAALASGEGYLAAVIIHEICHGLGPSFARTPQGKRPINEARRTGSGVAPAKWAIRGGDREDAGCDPITSLAKELLTIDASGDRLRNEAWFAK